ncbi:MAG: hypothetical protein KJ709_00355 [Nanoarchaeota archaeon]|nr:hypothetical protein [Nanoarchaeota archaeon]
MRIAHRGASELFLENSPKAFRKAIQQGADWVECDVHKSKDGELIVMHDFDLSKTTTGKGLIGDMSLSEIRKFELKNGEPIPTLRDVIDLIKGKAGLYCELKVQGMEEEFVRIVTENGHIDKTIAISFHHPVLKKIKQLEPRIKTSVLVTAIPMDPIAVVRSAGADFFHPCWEYRLARPHKLSTPDLINSLKKEGIGIISWHEERYEELRELMKLGLVGICTNRPDILSMVVKACR